MALSAQDAQAIAAVAQQLQVDPRVLGGLMELESGVNPNIWGGQGGQYRGLIQFGPGARKEVGLPDREMTISEQMPYVLKYFQQRGFKPGEHGPTELYRTVLVGNPNQSGTDSFGTNSDSAAKRMQPGGDLYQRFSAKFDKVGGAAAPASLPRRSAGSDDSWMDAFASSILKPSSMEGMDAGAGMALPTGSVIDASDPLKTLANASLRMAGADETRARFQGLKNSIAALTAATFPGMKPISAADLMLPEERQAMQSSRQNESAVEALQAMLGGGNGQREQGVAMSAPTSSGGSSGGPLRVGRVAKPGEDVFPTTGPHLDVRIQDAGGEYINPANAKSILQNLYVGGKPLYQQTASGVFEPSYPVTSPFGARAAPTAGASTFHRGKDFGVEANTPLEWRGGGSYSFSGGVGVIDLPDGRKVKLLHTRPS